MTKLLFATLLIALVPNSVFAVDGVVLINQATVLAAGGFPYRITQPGSYRLSGNLTTPDINTSAIVITADNVTLDLNGFSIIGPAVCGGIPASCVAFGTGVGVVASANRGVSVMNGGVQGMGSTAVNVGDGGRIEKMRITGNGGGIVAQRNGIVADNVVTYNVTFSAINVITSTVSGNIVSYNRFTGIFANCPSLIIGNTAFSNGLNIGSTGVGCNIVNNAAP